MRKSWFVAVYLVYYAHFIHRSAILKHICHVSRLFRYVYRLFSATIPCMRKKRSIAVLVLFAILSYFGANTKSGAALFSSNTPHEVFTSTHATCETKPSATTTLYCVTHVVDGDTIDISMEGKSVRIRLLGINTPETVDPRRPVQCFGKDASNRAKEILSGKWVSVESDLSQDAYDKYGRKLLYVYTADGTLFNKQMIRDGYAHEYTYRYPYKYQEVFRAAEHDARIHERGLWAKDSCAGRN